MGRTARRLAASTTKNISKTAWAEGLQKSELTLLFLEELRNLLENSNNKSSLMFLQERGSGDVLKNPGILQEP